MYNPHHNGVAATGRTARGDELYRNLMAIVLVLVPIDAILGHTALNRVLESADVVSWVLAVFVSVALAGLAHVIGHVLARRGWVPAILFTLIWVTTVGSMAYVRWLESGKSATSTGGLSMDTQAPTSLATVDNGPRAAMVLMVAIFLLTGALSAIAGAHRSPAVEMRKKALASLASTETELKQAGGDLARARELHRAHEAQVQAVDLEAARAVQGQRQLTELLVVRAAIALREKTGDTANDFHLQAPAASVGNPEADRLLRLLDDPKGEV